ncbi:Dot/Icm T4SS effector Wip [Legionella nagasakiensis]|uniref:Dot/Icm T4SS effector Wip n=1 Tax=Legionella nagasakiensis TaxID=535290 RepID=UPI001054BE52|nr:Dot/Icm T4SS effector Wip [Legionella nagasakiensis]
MSKEIKVRTTADLDKCPDVLASAAEHTHVSVGDLHGNALKLIYTLIEEGFLKVTPEQYKDLHDIYYTRTSSLTADDLETFRAIIDSAVINTDRSLTLIGDELADRGNNDYFTLLVLKKLHDANLDVDIMVSNHSAEFIRDYEHRRFTGIHQLFGNQGQSLTNMQRLIARGLVDEGEVRQIVDDCYKPMVKAIGYTVSPEGEITLFSHAPIGLETIEALANKFSIPYHEDSPTALITTINAINERIYTLFTEKTLASLIDQEGHSDPKDPVPPTKPLMRLVWNRAIGDELRTEPRGGFKVSFVHGHIGDGEILQHGTTPLPSHRNLDGWFGKDRELSRTGTLRDAYGLLDVRHFTQHSSELTAKQLIHSSTARHSEVLADLVAVAHTHEARMRMQADADYLKIRQVLADTKNLIRLELKEYDVPQQKQEKLLHELDEAATAYHRGDTTAEDYRASLDDLTSRVNEQHEKVKQHIAFNHALALLAAKNVELQEKAKHDPKNYKKAAEASDALLKALSTNSEQYFTQDKIDAKTFKTQCDQSIKTATTELEKHRGVWYQLSPIIRGIIGVIAIIGTIATAGIPAAAVAAFSKRGYSDTFFSTPDTDSMEKVKNFQKAYQAIIKSDDDEPTEKPSQSLGG